MPRLLLLTFFLSVLITGRAQTTLNAAGIKEKDSTIMADLVMPALQAALSDQTEPDWAELTQNIKSEFDDYFAERMIIKGKIYYYYERNWPEFTKSIVQFTEKYENKDNLKLM